jgi:hypothetical protein
MYEFLAPWGVLVPVLSAAICYFLSSESRRKAMLEEFEFTTREEPGSSRVDQSRLSVMHG